METRDPSPQEISLPANEALLVATINDVGDIQRLLQEASDFKWSQGDDLWGTEPFTEEEVTRMVESGDLFIFKVDGVTAASVLLPRSDERIWGDEQGGDELAIYVHKLCVSDAFRGQGIGGRVMSLAEDFARKEGRTKLRLDCPYDNESLCKYYEILGFQEVRKVDKQGFAGQKNPDKDVYRAALYEKELAGSAPA